MLSRLDTTQPSNGGPRAESKHSPTSKSGSLGPHQVQSLPPGVPGGDLAAKRASLAEASSGDSKATVTKRLGDFRVQVRKGPQNGIPSRQVWLSVLGGPTAARHASVAALLKSVDACHSALKAADARFNLAAVHTAHARLRHDLDVHLASLDKGAPDALKTLVKLVNREGEHLGVLGRLGSSRGSCGAMAPTDLLRLVRGGADSLFLEAAVEGRLSAADAQGYLDLTALSGMRLPAHVLDTRMRNGQGPAELRALLDAGYELTPRTFNPAYTEARRGPGAERPLGSGATATVTQVEYIVDGQTARMAFKADATSGVTEVSSAAGTTGVPREKPRMAGRNVGTFNVARRMGLEIVPRTALAAMKDGRVGCVMAVVPGRPGTAVGATTVALPADLQTVLRQASPERRQAIVTEYAAKAGFDAGAGNRSVRLEETAGAFRLAMEARLEVPDLSADVREDGTQPTIIEGQPIATTLPDADPILRKQLTQAQWLDLLLGQVDRNPQNLMVSDNPDGSVRQLSLIDNDACLGAKCHDPRQLARVSRSFASALPRVIDRQTHDRLIKMTPAMLSADLSGLVTPEEIAATEARLKEIQAHLATFAEGGGLILEADAQWGTQAVADALGVDTDATRFADEVKKALGEGEAAFNKLNMGLSKRQDAARETSYLAREATAQAFNLGMRKAVAEFLKTPAGREVDASNGRFIQWLQAELDRLPPIYDPALLAQVAGLEPKLDSSRLETKAQAKN